MKHVLFDENMPRKLRAELSDLIVRTAQEMEWGGLRNGELLRRAAETFDVLLTIDQRMRYQQNIRQFAIGVVVIETYDTTLDNLRRLLPEIRLAIETVGEGEVVIVKT